MQKLIVANWKMNGDFEKVKDDIRTYVSDSTTNATNVVLALPMPYFGYISQWLNTINFKIASQDVSIFQDSGAYTGEVSAKMLKDLDVSYVLVGHSERRYLLGEDDGVLVKKLQNVIESKMTPIFCIGESLEVRQNKQHLLFLADQLTQIIPTLALATNVVIAYEPIWSIGSGMVPTIEQIEEVMDFIHMFMQKCANHVKIASLYGGSVVDKNAKDILSIPQVGGVLVGGASLETRKFSAICSHVNPN